MPPLREETVASVNKGGFEPCFVEIPPKIVTTHPTPRFEHDPPLVVQVDPTHNPQFVMGPDDEVPRLGTREELAPFGVEPHRPPPEFSQPQYHVFAETRAQVENSTDPRSIGSYDGNALKALEYVAHCLDQDAEIIVIQRMRP